MQGFRLTQEAVNAGFSGGTVKVSDAGHLFNIGQALMEEDSDGQATINTGKIIVVDDEILGEVLSGYPGLERVAAEAVPGDVEPVKSPAAHLAAMPVGPYTPQTNSENPGQPVLITESNLPPTPPTNDVGAGADLASPVTAEHADDPDTVEGAIAAGEQVSGLPTSNQEGDSQSQDSEATDSNPAGNDQ